MTRFFHSVLLASFFYFGFFTMAHGQVLEEDVNKYVKKGFYLGFDVGPYFLALKPNSVSVADVTEPSSSTVGLVGGIEMGYDLGKWVSLHLSLLGAHVQGNPQTGGGSSNLMASLGATFFVARISQLQFFVKLAVGGVFVFPQTIFPTGLIVQGGLGLKYYSRRTGFAVGLEVLAFFAPPLTDQGFFLGIGVQPCISYTF